MPAPDRRRFLACSLAAGLCGACGSPPARATAGQLVQMHIVERASGDIAAEHRHRGSTYVAGRPGDRYAVRLSNRSGARVLVVLSVDGVNAITGETAATGQAGYVLGPWQTADITGWRKSDAEAAAFYFTALPDSYAARTDRPQNVGVIGAAVFRERTPWLRPAPFPPAPVAGTRAAESDARGGPESSVAAAGAARESSSSGAGGAANQTPPAAAPPDRARRDDHAKRTDRTERLGTGHGEREYAPIHRTAFERATSQPAGIVQIRYDSHANLVAAGVIPPARRWGVPEPFPGYVPDPR
jgi:hypothetical protein